MKTLFTALLFIFTYQLSAQSYSTINFVTYRDYGWVFSIYLNDQLVGSVAKGDNLEYKIYSEGRISVVAIAQSARYTGLIDVQKGNTYYFGVSAYPKFFGLTDSARGAKVYMANSNTIKVEEDRATPLIRTTKVEDEGPKQGTCFLINNQGYLLTNYHVISGAKSIHVKGVGNDFSTLYGVDVVAYDVDLDLALLKFKNPNISFDSIPYGFSSENSQQGAKSFVLGYPLTTAMGEGIKVTEGIISSNSGYKGSISQYQLSAAVQPGNSGSPLFNDDGDIIGIVNAKLQGAEGAGYAIKSEYLNTFLKLTGNTTTEKKLVPSSSLSLADRVAKLKNFVYIVKAE